MNRSSNSLSLAALQNYSEQFGIPLEDALFTAINYYGLRWDVPFNRMRTAFHLDGTNPAFLAAKDADELNYYLALPVRQDSPFRIRGETVQLGESPVGQVVGATEDYCDSHYSRRLGTSLNINPNTRTSCRGCDFCYTAYQVPLDRKRMSTKSEIEGFFTEWMDRQRRSDLTHLIQLSVVTGCYSNERQLVDFLLTLRGVAEQHGFAGKLFYLGSTLTTRGEIDRLAASGPFGYCMSVECFERRDLLHRLKRALSLDEIARVMADCMDAGVETNYTYIVGLEPIETFLPHMRALRACTNKFPTMNILQLHQQHSAALLDGSADNLAFFYRARLAIEELYADTRLRPLVWEDYRGLWYLTFHGEPLAGPRFPDSSMLETLARMQ